MIKILLTIEQVNGRIELNGKGVDVGRASELESDFTDKFVKHLSGFNSTYKGLKKGERSRVHITRGKGK